LASTCSISSARTCDSVSWKPSGLSLERDSAHAHPRRRRLQAELRGPGRSGLEWLPLGCRVVPHTLGHFSHATPWVFTPLRSFCLCCLLRSFSGEEFMARNQAAAAAAAQQQGQ
jgi:hypothetical protein